MKHCFINNFIINSLHRNGGRSTLQLASQEGIFADLITSSPTAAHWLTDIAPTGSKMVGYHEIQDMSVIDAHFMIHL
jgi:hypothetical protein